MFIIIALHEYLIVALWRIRLYYVSFH